MFIPKAKNSSVRPYIYNLRNGVNFTNHFKWYRQKMQMRDYTVRYCFTSVFYLAYVFGVLFELHFLVWAKVCLYALDT